MHLYLTNFSWATLKKSTRYKETIQWIASSCRFPLILLEPDKSGSDLHVYGTEMEHQSQSNTIRCCRVFGLQAVTLGFHSISIKSHISPVICEPPRSGILTIMNHPLVYYFHLPYLKDLLLQEHKVRRSSMRDLEPQQWRNFSPGAAHFANILHFI